MTGRYDWRAALVHIATMIAVIWAMVAALSIIICGLAAHAPDAIRWIESLHWLGR